MTLFDYMDKHPWYALFYTLIILESIGSYLKYWRDTGTKEEVK